MRKKSRPLAFLINDVSENPRSMQVVRKFARSFYGEGCQMVKASSIRRRVFSYLEKQTKKRKYDLILTGDTGGTLMFTDRQLLRFGNRVRRIPYSLHGRPENLRYSALWKEVGALGSKPRVLVLEADVGPRGHTIGKLAIAKGMIMQRKGDACIDILAGVATMAAGKGASLKYVAYPTCAKPVRLSELLEKAENIPAMPELFDRELVGRVSELLKIKRWRSLHTGTLPH